MTDRDRLIELLNSVQCKVNCCIAVNESCADLDNLDRCQIQAIADYLIANGVILRPCKVWDTVYSFDYDWQKAKDVIAPYQITNITITQNKKGVWTKKYRAMRILNGKTIDRQLNFSFDEIGKTVFLTKEEAENRVKE